MMEANGFQNVNNVLIQSNDCIIEVIKNNNIIDETKNFMNFLISEDWLEIVDNGTHQEVLDALGEGMDGLTGKLLNQYGADIAVQMPIEMIDWIKDSTRLWVRDGGAGHTTNEATVIEESKIHRLERELNEQRDFYDK